IWLGGKVDGETRVAIAEYNSEYWPGPMTDGTFDPEGDINPDYRVYKLYKDSATANPNLDYLEYPDHAAPLGAPVDHKGRPLIRGDQTLWAVFNDANPDQHINDAGETAPLGIEVQMSMWASDDKGKSPVRISDGILYNNELDIRHTGTLTGVEVTAYAADPALITGDDYRVYFVDTDLSWNLENITTNTLLAADQPINSTVEFVEGLSVSVTYSAPGGPFTSFEVVANAAGVLDPPEPGALVFAGFPVPTEYDPDGYISPRQQATGDGQWAIHTDDNGGSCAGGTRGDYEAFIDRVTRDGDRLQEIGQYDYEIRFTGSNSNPGVEGGYAAGFWSGAFWVPFELWRTGIGTPDDPTDDVRLVPQILEREYPASNTFALDNWGCFVSMFHSGLGEHSASGDDDDPYTDVVYWLLPVDDSPGEAGYLACEETMEAGELNYALIDGEVIARTVLINWNGGYEPPFNQALPEVGTVFRLVTKKVTEPTTDLFEFTSTQPPFVTAGAEGQSIYLSYKLHNKGGNTIDDCYITLWNDPDVGDAGDDLVGCDTLDHLWYCYNANNIDQMYGSPVPAVGFKCLYGPIVPSPGDSAYFDGSWIADHKNMNVSVFNKYINGTDPDNFEETYGFMRGLTKAGTPYVYEDDTLMYVHTGDPVTGTGDLDIAPADRRMLASFGPLTFNPGDSQYVLVRMAVAQGSDRLNSITRLREILNERFKLHQPGSVDGQSVTTNTNRFTVRQNYPNPFNPSTTIMYSLQERARVTVDVYNVLGQRVRRLIDETQPAGNHSVIWNGDDNSGGQVASGFYFYRVKAGDKIDNKKMLLLK
ncbi:MAG: T9SS type A sorting domain-containing protein, partial [Candidatus Zixiibacteriota bacterium]